MYYNNDRLIMLDTKEAVSEAFDRLFPLCRSILGKGYRDSLHILQEYIPFEEEQYLTGEKVLNWGIPQEWVIREAWIEDSYGKRVCDYTWNNLHVVNYSAPIDMVLSLDELKKHIYTSASIDEAIPYTTSYYKKRWGFCMTKKELMSLPEGQYHVYIDSDFIDGSLVIGETVLPGETNREVLLTSYLCHPSMANNELSGPLVQAMLYQQLQKWEHRRYTYRFVINPETIGSIAYLSRHANELKINMFAGLVLTCLGGEEPLRLKKSRNGDAPFDYVTDRMIRENLIDFPLKSVAFTPISGSDERQYCSAGFQLPVSQFSRKVYGSYKEYHTSLDNKELMGIDNIIESCRQIETVLQQLERERYYKNLYPYGEVKLGDFNLYPTLNSDGAVSDGIGAVYDEPWFVQCVMMILNYSDGTRPISYIADEMGIEENKAVQVAELLKERGLCKEINV